MNITRRQFAFGAYIVSLMLAGCGSGPQEPKEQNEPATIDTSVTDDEKKPKDLVVTESGFSPTAGGVACYAAIIENPNNTWAAENINVSISARDTDGNVLDTTSDSITLMFTNGKTAIAGIIKAPKGTSSVEFVPTVNTNGWSKRDISQKEFYDQLPISGLTASTDQYERTTITGEVSNNTDGTFSLTRVNLVLRNSGGKIVGGGYTFLDGELQPGTSLPFSTDMYEAPDYASVEAYPDCGYPQGS